LGKLTGKGDASPIIDSASLRELFSFSSLNSPAAKLGSYFFWMPEGTRYFVTIVILKDPPI
jgi:hypothetical protein